MTEWWTYRPEDFLMFSPRTYWRLFELHNQAWWPLQPVAIGAGVAWMAWAARGGGPAALRTGAAGLAVAWGFVAWAFVWQRYAPVNWAAQGLAAGLVLLGLCLAALALQGGWRPAPTGARRIAGLGLVGWALVGHPLLAPAFGRPWWQAEGFALAPDPTAVATLGWLLAVQPVGRAARWTARAAGVGALAWCAVSAATLWTLGVPAQAGVLAVASALALAAAGRRRAPTGAQ